MTPTSFFHSSLSTTSITTPLLSINHKRNITHKYQQKYTSLPHLCSLFVTSPFIYFVFQVKLWLSQAEKITEFRNANKNAPVDAYGTEAIPEGKGKVFFFFSLSPPSISLSLPYPSRPSSSPSCLSLPYLYRNSLYVSDVQIRDSCFTDAERPGKHK